jgi:DNA-binding transcriptional LysR family regulator
LARIQSLIGPLEGIEIRYFATLSAVAEECSFRGAARRLGYAPSVISAQIATLERQLGVQLVNRRARASGATLTDAGRVLANQAELIIAHLHSVRRELDALLDGGGPPLEVGIVDAVGARVLARLACAFRGTGSDVSMQPREFTCEADAYVALSRGEVELAVLSTPPPQSGFGACEVLREHFVLASPRSWSLPRRLSVDALERLPLIGANSSSARAQVERYLRGTGTELRIVARADNESTIHALIAEGFGAAFVPESARLDDSDIVLLRLYMLEGLRHVPAIVWSKSRKKSAQAAVLIEAASELPLGTSVPEKASRPMRSSRRPSAARAVTGSGR